MVHRQYWCVLQSVAFPPSGQALGLVQVQHKGMLESAPMEIKKEDRL